MPLIHHIDHPLVKGIHVGITDTKGKTQTRFLHFAAPPGYLEVNHQGLSTRAIRMILLVAEDPVTYSSEYYLSKQNIIDSCYDSVIKQDSES